MNNFEVLTGFVSNTKVHVSFLTDFTFKMRDDSRLTTCFCGFIVIICYGNVIFRGFEDHERVRNTLPEMHRQKQAIRLTSLRHIVNYVYEISYMK